MIIRFLFDPRVFNWIIMSLYACAVLRWLIAWKPYNAGYWFGALCITVCVTWGYQKP
ncbi:MAG TPA: hypothetical protein VKR31_10385 [Rhizomicrobium sp.]|nr:hypothetical protein [Rhizomicrobium sp.]